MSSFSKFDRILILVCISFISGLSGVYSSSNLTIQHLKTEFIGHISDLKNNVQIKQPQDFIWTDLQSNDLIQKNDCIFVGQNSQARVEFLNGQSILLKENSMLSFTQNEKSFDIALNYGEFQSDKVDQMIEIDICGKKELINAADAKKIDIKKSKNCKFEIKSEEGQFEFAQKKVSSLKQIESSVILSERTLSVKETADSDKDIELIADNNQFNLESATDTNLFQISDPLQESITPLTPPIASAKPIAPKIHFFAPTIDTSYMKKNFYSQQDNSSNIYLRWQNSNNEILVKESLIEISKNLNFSPVLHSDVTTKNFILLKLNLKKGRYYWRVKFKSKSETSDESVIAQFALF